jgi:hypothetical protein
VGPHRDARGSALCGLDEFLPVLHRGREHELGEHPAVVVVGAVAAVAAPLLDGERVRQREEGGAGEVELVR